MEKQFLSRSISDLKQVAELIVRLMNERTIFLLEGNLGAGKTTLVQTVCELLHSTDVVVSPTFSLINPYQTDKGTIYHMDMYRIKSVEEAIDFGIEEYLWEDHFCFIEWPQIIEELLPEKFVRIRISQQADETRLIQIHVK
ncbi:MAG TPA: tRNA (adenosine(37)-N6)-threonylcarbamoyltransferase complex ATPase subunit type 1 TsaE [Saprospiraceae bacterium]|nr:tRNA (adenosine(37)-N6)-threonylcarbamoyltransferase complex ATPase subunit type 1 TsaE [Saprospiraceae bacterium]